MGQLVIVGTNGRQSILVDCCTQYMLYSVLTHYHGMDIYRMIN